MVSEIKSWETTLRDLLKTPPENDRRIAQGHPCLPSGAPRLPDPRSLNHTQTLIRKAVGKNPCARAISPCPAADVGKFSSGWRVLTAARYRTFAVPSPQNPLLPGRCSTLSNGLAMIVSYKVWKIVARLSGEKKSRTDHLMMLLNFKELKEMMGGHNYAHKQTFISECLQEAEPAPMELPWPSHPLILMGTEF